jgi:putative addiction module component (TIGR02574 family)
MTADGALGQCNARLARMNARVDHVLDEVLALPAEERSAVAVALLDSLEHADTPEIDAAWRAEIQRRRDALRAGIAQATPWTEVKQRLRSL